MCQGITHGWPSSRSTLSWGLQVHQCLLWRIHGCVIPGRSSTKGSVGPPGTCFSYAGVLRRWSICGGIMLGWVGSPPRRYREDTWPQVVVHLKPPPCAQQVFRNRFHPTTDEREIYVAIRIWKTCPTRRVENWRKKINFEASYLKKVCLYFSFFVPFSQELNLDKKFRMFSFLKQQVCNKSIIHSNLETSFESSPVKNNDTMIRWFCT